MNNPMEETKIIDYLYDEMSSAERHSFEKQLATDPQLRGKVESMKSVREAIIEVEDDEVVPPAFVFNQQDTKIVPFFSSSPFRWVSSIAAGLALLLTVGYLLQFNISSDQDGVQVAFGKIQEEKTDVSKDDVRSWMMEAMAEMNQDTESKLTNLEIKLNDKIDSQDKENLNNIKAMMAEYSDGTDQLMRQYVAQVSDDNKQMIESFFEVSSDAQQQYVQHVLADFNDFYQNQRSHDLKVIESSIDLMKNNYDVSQLEQDNLLANLYSIVQTQSR